MKKLNAKDLALLGISLALLIVSGRILFQLSQLLPLPSSRVLVTAPIYGFILAAIGLYTRKVGAATLLSLAYGLYLLQFSPFSMIATTLGGLLCDIVTKLVFGGYDTNRKIYLSVPLKSAFSVLTSYFVVNTMIPNSSFQQAAFIPTLIMAVIIYFVGYLAARYAIRLLAERPAPADRQTEGA